MMSANEKLDIDKSLIDKRALPPGTRTHGIQAILDTIVSDLPTRDLLSCQRASRPLCKAASAVLYDTCCYHVYKGHIINAKTANGHFYRSVITQVEEYPSVQVSHFCPQCNATIPSSHPPSGHEDVVELFRQCANLRRVDVNEALPIEKKCNKLITIRIRGALLQTDGTKNIPGQTPSPRHPSTAAYDIEDALSLFVREPRVSGGNPSIQQPSPAPAALEATQQACLDIIHDAERLDARVCALEFHRVVMNIRRLGEMCASRQASGATGIASISGGKHLPFDDVTLMQHAFWNSCFHGSSREFSMVRGKTVKRCYGDRDLAGFRQDNGSTGDETRGEDLHRLLQEVQS